LQKTLIERAAGAPAKLGGLQNVSMGGQYGRYCATGYAEFVTDPA